MTRLIVSAAIAMVAMSTIAAQAGPLTASQILASYNLVTQGNATTSSDIEGNVVVGGNFNGATVFNNNKPTNPEIDIYGANQRGLNVNGGVVHYGSSNAGTLHLNNGATAQQGNFPHALSELTAPLNQLSAELAVWIGNSSIQTGSGKATFVETPPANGIAVFSLTAAMLQNDLTNNSIFFSGSASSIIVNVSGNFSEPSGTNWNPPIMQNVLFNFFNATAVSVGNWDASLLAPFAAVNIMSGNISGFVYANTFNGGGELHNDPFVGSLAVSEPGALEVLGLALIGVVAARTTVTRRSIA